MNHMKMLCDRSETSDGDFSGHALMVSCPPSQHLIDHSDREHSQQATGPVFHADLLSLLDVSNRLPLDGEIAPIMAWFMLTQDEKFEYLEPLDFERIKEILMTKAKCYG